MMDDGVAGVGGAGNSFYFLWQEAVEQRDELLDCLDELVEIFEDCLAAGSCREYDSFTVQPSKTAIAKVKGQQ